ncbi:MAG: hypothetical protein V3U19_03905 [Thermodesulfobacteriota bacterium]
MENKKGKTRMTYVKKSDLYEIKAKAEQYARKLVKNPRILMLSSRSTSLFLKVNILQKSLLVL